MCLHATVRGVLQSAAAAVPCRAAGVPEAVCSALCGQEGALPLLLGPQRYSFTPVRASLVRGCSEDNPSEAPAHLFKAQACYWCA